MKKKFKKQKNDKKINKNYKEYTEGIVKKKYNRYKNRRRNDDGYGETDFFGS